MKIPSLPRHSQHFGAVIKVTRNGHPIDTNDRPAIFQALLHASDQGINRVLEQDKKRQYHLNAHVPPAAQLPAEQVRRRIELESYLFTEEDRTNLEGQLAQSILGFDQWKPQHKKLDNARAEKDYDLYAEVQRGRVTRDYIEQTPIEERYSVALVPTNHPFYWLGKLFDHKKPGKHLTLFYDPKTLQILDGPKS
jgi:hypothetical protein